MLKSKILRFIATLLLAFSLNISNVLADGGEYIPSSYVQSLISAGYTITAVLTGNIWLISVYDPDTAEIIMDIEEEI